MRSFNSFLVLAALVFTAAPIGAETIDFEDPPATNDQLQTLSEEYAHLGVHFSTTDDGATWGGLSRGDPGQWQLEGSNGSTFLGFDGESYSAVVYFDEPVQEFRLDAARGEGTVSPYDSFMLAGFREGFMVGVEQVSLGDVNSWTTVSMSVEVDTIFLYGVGFPGYRFGIDNLRWVGEESGGVLSVEIDIRPGSETSPINPSSQVNAINPRAKGAIPVANPRAKGVIPVAILGSESVDVADVDVNTLAFGPWGAIPVHRGKGHVADVNGDGYEDLVSHYWTRDTGIAQGDEQACVTGLLSGTEFTACEAISVIR